MRDSFYYIEEMKKLGYETKFEILNAMDFGIPQNRDRIFAISYYGENPFSLKNLKERKHRILKNILKKM